MNVFIIPVSVLLKPGNTWFAFWNLFISSVHIWLSLGNKSDGSLILNKIGKADKVKRTK